MQNLMRRFGVFMGGGSRFDRYYGGLIGDGAGYPTADEARRDLRNLDMARDAVTWQR